VPQKYIVYTLADITNTGVTNPRTLDVKGYNQQQNLNTVLQLIGLRSQPYNYLVEPLLGQDVVNYGFGIVFKGLHTVWKLEFLSEHTDVYTLNDNNIHFLIEDCDGAAFTSGLDDTAKFSTNNFETKNKELINMYFHKC
jgi:hypothetical protein